MDSQIEMESCMISHILPNAKDLKELAATHYQYIDNQKIALNRLNNHLFNKARSSAFSTSIRVIDYIPEKLFDGDSLLREKIILFYKDLLISSLKKNDFLVHVANGKDLTYLTLYISWEY